MNAAILSANELPASPISGHYSETELPVILLVDDDAGMRRFVHAVVGCAMASSGFLAEVIEAADAETARAVSREIGSIDLLISDICLGPGDSGLDLARDLVRHNPRMRVLLMSGAEARKNDLPDGWVFLLKPFRVSELFDFVNSLFAHNTA